MKTLQGLRWQPAHITHMGCIKSCFDYLGIGISRAWLYGGTGHAFVMNYGRNACPSGPTAWDTRMLYELAPNLGYRDEGISVWKPDDDALFAQKQREAWDLVRAAIDQGLPCYGWQMQIPEYYLVHGYDDVGYLFLDWDGPPGKGPLPWQKLATWDVTLIEVRRVVPCPPAPDDKAVREALTRVLELADRSAGSGGPAYAFGPAAFTAWAADLEAGTASRDGHAFNADAWHECRNHAVGFLQEAQQRLAGRCDAAFADAIGHYTLVRDRLQAVRELCPQRPWQEHWSECFHSPESAALLREAGTAEEQGLVSLRRIVDTLL